VGASGLQEDEKDMETTGGSKWSSPPPTHIPLSGAAAWILQDWPGQRTRMIYLLLFIVSWWDSGNAQENRAVGEGLGLRTGVGKEKEASLVCIILLSRTDMFII
jgi:hypothetical protein